MKCNKRQLLQSFKVYDYSPLLIRQAYLTMLQNPGKDAAWSILENFAKITRFARLAEKCMTTLLLQISRSPLFGLHSISFPLFSLYITINNTYSSTLYGWNAKPASTSFLNSAWTSFRACTTCEAWHFSSFASFYFYWIL